MYAILQAIFTVLTLALTVPLFKSYRLHIIFECFKVAASVWNGGIFFFDVMPRKKDAKKKRKFSGTLAKESVEPVSLNSTGLPIEGASVTDPPISPGGISPKSGTSDDEQMCSLCRKPSSIDLVDLDAYARHDGQTHVRKGRKIEAVLETREGGLDLASSLKQNGSGIKEVDAPQEPAVELLGAACAS